MSELDRHADRGNPRKHRVERPEHLTGARTHERRDLPLVRITEIVTAAVDDWIGDKEQPDDVTLVLARAR